MDTLTYPKEVLKIFETRPKLKKGLVCKDKKLYVAHINKGEKKNYKLLSNAGIKGINEFTLKGSLNILFPLSAFEDIYADSVDCYVSYIKEPDKERNLSLNNSRAIIGLYIPKGTKTESGVEVLEEIIIEIFVSLFSLESKIFLKALNPKRYEQLVSYERSIERQQNRADIRREYRLEQEAYFKEQRDIAKKNFEENFTSYVNKILSFILNKDKKFARAARAYSQNMFITRVKTRFKEQLYSKEFSTNEVDLIFENWEKICAFIAQAGRASAFQAEGQGFKSP